MKSILFAALLFPSLGTSTFNGHAQETNPPAMIQRPQPGGPNRLMDSAVFGVLTPEQRGSIVRVLQEQQPKAREIQTRLRIVRQEMVSTALSGQFDDDAVRKLALEVANLEAELTVQRMKALSQVLPSLSPDQVEKIRNMGQIAPFQSLRPPESRPGRQRILQNIQRDQNGLPPKM
jgi:Spy/CpxP family protein refolding chaperone